MRISAPLGGVSSFILFGSLWWTGTMLAEPIVYQATGTREQIQPIIDQFKNDVIYGPGQSPQNPPSVLGSFRMATFDDVSAGSDGTLNPPTFISGGLQFVSVINGLLVSSGSELPEDPDRLFGDINPNYPLWLEASSPPSVLAAALRGIGGQQIIVHYAPFDFYQRLNAFGATFVDVDFPSAAAVEVNLVDGPSVPQSTFVVPAHAAEGKLSFLGVIFSDEVIWGSGVTIRLPGLPLSQDLRLEDPLHDIVAVDDVIFGVAPPIPEPSITHLLSVAGILTGAAGWFKRHDRVRCRLKSGR